MIDLLLTTPWAVTVLVFSLCVTALGIVFRRISHRTIGVDDLRKSHDVAGIVYANVAVLYSIVLGLMAVHGQDRWIDIRETAEREGALIASVGRSAAMLNDEAGAHIQRAAAAYAESVIEYEWDDDEDGAAPETQAALEHLWDIVQSMERTPDRDVLASQTVLVSANDLVETRMKRLSLMREHVGPLLWTILLGGGLTMIAFLLLFAPERPILHTMFLMAVSLVVSTVLMLIFSFEHPTDGALALSPEAYTFAVDALKRQPVFP